MVASVSRKYPRGARRSPAAKLRLTGAYQAMFAGNGSKEDAGLVLTDLAAVSRFYMVAPSDAPSDVRAFVDGQRSVFLHIFNFLRMSDAEVADLERAAREEIVTSMNEGEF